MKKNLARTVIIIFAVVTLINYRWLVYLAHVSAHQAKVILYSESIDKRLLRGDLPAEERKLLKVTSKIRAFVEQAYGLKNSQSYRKYYDLGRNYLGYNITVTPEFSLKPKAFSFWPIGSFDYLGFFSREMAEEWAARYRVDNADVHISEIGGYSTLGWFEDPLYSTQLAAGEFALARLLAHEIAHERLYFKNDTTTSEMLASFMETRLALDYLAASGKKLPDEAEILAQRRRARDFAAAIDHARSRLEKLYAATIPAEEMRRQKRQIFKELHQALIEIGRNRAGLTRLRDIPPPEALNNAWLVQFHRYSPQSTALDALYRRCTAEDQHRKYRCWFEKLEKLKICTNEQRTEWLKSDGSVIEGYCRR